jgi:metal-responsive CopG/Arc/MetJ family transcriptional regulator
MGLVKKTSVYLDDDLLADLAGVALATGRSQSQLIRDGVRQVVRDNTEGRPRLTVAFDGACLRSRMDDLMEDFGR